MNWYLLEIMVEGKTEYHGIIRHWNAINIKNIHLILRKDKLIELKV